MTVRIVTDSACDLTPAESDDLGIEVVSLTIRFGEREYVDRRELTVEGFYRELATSTTLPETAAPAPGAFATAYSKLRDEGATDIVCINLSSGLSATMQSAQTAANAQDGVRVHVIDSRSITAGLGSQVLAAARLAAAGADADAVIEHVRDLIARQRVYGTLDTLENLKKGGRIGGAQALLGGMLSIKPLLDLTSGEVAEAGKVRTRKKALQWLRDRLVQDQPVENLNIIHGEAPDLDEFLQLLEGVVDVNTARIGKIGAVIGTHGGPRVMGVAYHVPR